MISLSEQLICHKIIEKGHYILRSGKHSNTYIRKTKITTIPFLYNSIIRSLMHNISKNIELKGSEIITVPAVAGICFASPIALLLGLPFVFPEKKEYKKLCDLFGLMKFRKEFETFIKNKEIIIIEDIVTTGGSVAKTARAIKECGGNPVAVFCIWNRNPNIDHVKYEHRSTYCNNIIDDPVSHSYIPIYSLVEQEIKDWNASECPMCKRSLPFNICCTTGI